MRLTVRRLMIAVAVVAFLFGGVTWTVRMRRLSSVYRGQAARYARNGQESLRSANHFERFYARSAQAEYVAPLVQYLRERAEFEARLERKYRHAASRPWEAVPPDPSPLVHPW
jgi:hypothetical protein